VTKARLDQIARPVLWLRSATWLMATVVVIALAAAVRAVLLELPAGIENAFVALQVLESGIQDVVFIGLALAFLITAENRLRRRRALSFIRELRAIAHIVDMHQLTKDPEQIGSSQPDTASSPARAMSQEQLGRYLDYCTELLSVVSKLSALYVQDMNDPVVLEAVSEVETLSGGLSSKIWQKITLLDRTRAPDTA
jgi:hypothetical protein